MIITVGHVRPVMTGAMIALASWASAGAALAEVPPGRQTELLYLLKHDCGSCHGMTLKGGLGKPLEPSSLQSRSDDDLAGVILDGMPGTPMPPWRPLLTPEEVRWLVGALRDGRTMP